MAVDAGTTGVRAVVVDGTGAVVDQAYRALASRFPRPGWVEQDPAEIWTAVRSVLAEVAGRLPDRGPVAAVGVANQRETVVAWDRRTGAAAGPAIVWQDRRTAARCDQLRDAGLLPEVRARTGLVLDPYFSATKMAWLLAGDGPARAIPAGRLALGTVDTWVVWNLTGGPDGGAFVTDTTNACRTLLFDIGRLAWSDELCRLFGVPAAALAEVRPSCGRVGTVDPAAAGDAGHRLGGVPVSAVVGDQHAALFGQACFGPGSAKVTYGTGSFVLVNAGPARPRDADGLLTTVAWDLGAHGGSRPPVDYALEGSAFSSGSALDWLANGLGVIAGPEEVGPLAGSVTDSGGLAVVPAFAGLGSPWWDPRARGTVTGITRGTGRAQLARAVVEALAFEVRAMVDAMADATGRPVAALRADGGAAVMDLLLQLQADQVRATVARPRSVESTALGAATMAGLAEGMWGSLDELAALWQLDAAFRPAVDGATADGHYAVWRRALDRARGWAPD